MKTLFILCTTVLLMVGCVTSRGSVRIVEKSPTQQVHENTVTQNQVPPAPKKKFKAKDIHDTNHSDAYMYPEDGAAAVKDNKEEKNIVNAPNISNVMTKEECISMISQEKFDKYSTMFGSETASLKRCTMLKAMNQ